MDSFNIVKGMHAKLRGVIDSFEAGEATIGRKVAMHEEAIGVLSEAVAELGVALSHVELELAKGRAE